VDNEWDSILLLTGTTSQQDIAAGGAGATLIASDLGEALGRALV
jgi:hypothetical protein